MFEMTLTKYKNVYSPNISFVGRGARRPEDLQILPEKQVLEWRQMSIQTYNCPRRYRLRLKYLHSFFLGGGIYEKDEMRK